MDKNKFSAKKVTKIEDLLSGKDYLVDSDLTLQTNDAIVQFEYKEINPPQSEAVPGCFTVTRGLGGPTLKPWGIKAQNLMTSLTNTKQIIHESNVFFNNLQMYDELEQPKRRGVLLYSQPGLGKSSTIAKLISDLRKEDSGTLVINWDMGTVSASDFEDFLNSGLKYSPKCSRMILVLEDIGGGEEEYSGSRRGVNSSLLNILDGVGDVFKLPTLIIATTNYPQNLLSALANRPGRFDLVLELKPPQFQERVDLAEFIAKRPLSLEEKEAFKIKGAEEFSFAHVKEVIIRSKLLNKPIPDVVKSLIEHSKKFKMEFTEPKERMGF